MKKKFFFILFFTVLFLTGLILIGIGKLPDLERLVLERAINQNAKPFFADSVRIEKVHIDRSLKIRVEGIRGAFQARQGPVLLEMKSVESQDSLLSLLAQKPVLFLFEGARPKNSSREGVFGSFSFRAGKSWSFDFTADFQKTDLEDFQWLSPQDLEGATGAMNGKLIFTQEAGKYPVFDMNLEAPQPGGRLQARFFDLFLPYLPKSVQKERVVKLVSKKEQLVQYQNAELQVGLPQSDRMKILLHILVLDYNLKLTLNVEVRMDQKNAFSQIAQLMGMIEVKLS